MKKFIVVLGLLSVVAFLAAACGKLSESNVELYDEVEYVEVLYSFFPRSLADMVEQSDYIVVGRLMQDTEFIPEGVYKGIPYERTTVTSMEVVEVIKGDLKRGEIIKLSEPYHIEDRILFVKGNYLPSIVGQDYYFFLIKPVDETGDRPEIWSDNHLPTGREYGRYLVPSERNRSNLEAYSREELSLGENRIDLYMRIYQEVVEAYME